MVAAGDHLGEIRGPWAVRRVDGALQRGDMVQLPAAGPVACVVILEQWRVRCGHLTIDMRNEGLRTPLVEQLEDMAREPAEHIASPLEAAVHQPSRAAAVPTVQPLAAAGTHGTAAALDASIVTATMRAEVV
jgi:hypothetical protein